MPYLAAKGIGKRFGATIALQGVDFDLERGEVHALVGENGSGKSTLMRVLSGEAMPDSGRMELDGRPYSPASPVDARRAGVALIHQELAVCGHLTVFENIFLSDLKARGARDRARAALGQLGHGDLDLDCQVRDLTVALRQVVEIARALALDAQVILFDEPTSSLTEADSAKLFEAIRGLRERGKAVIYISHYLDEVLAIADRYTVLRDGERVAQGPMAGATAEDLVKAMIGREVSELYPRTARESGEVVLRAERVSGRRLPKEASLSLRKGEVLGIAGLTGSGRTEFLRVLFGLDPMVSGSVVVGGRATGANPSRRWQQGVGLLSEDRKNEGLLVKMSVGENIVMSKLPAFGLVSHRQILRDALEWVGKLAVKCRAPDQQAMELSGGNQQKVALGRLIHHDVEVLLLDEPTRGIDVGSKAEIYRLVDRLACAGKAVLIVSSYIPELLGVCDRIAVMHRGVLGEAKPAQDWTAESILQEAAGA